MGEEEEEEEESGRPVKRDRSGDLRFSSHTHHQAIATERERDCGDFFSLSFGEWHFYFFLRDLLLQIMALKF